MKLPDLIISEDQISEIKFLQATRVDLNKATNGVEIDGTDTAGTGNFTAVSCEGVEAAVQ